MACLPAIISFTHVAFDSLFLSFIFDPKSLLLSHFCLFIVHRRHSLKQTICRSKADRTNNLNEKSSAQRLLSFRLVISVAKILFFINLQGTMDFRSATSCSIKMLALFAMLFHYVGGHGRLMEPPARNAMWRFGFPNPVNYNDNGELLHS